MERVVAVQSLFVISRTPFWFQPPVFQVTGEGIPDDQTWALDPDQTISEELVAPQPLNAGEYILEINFGDSDASIAGAPFSVQ